MKRTHLCVTDSQHQRGPWKGFQVPFQRDCRFLNTPLQDPPPNHHTSVRVVTFNTTAGICGIFKTLKLPAKEKGVSKEILLPLFKGTLQSLCQYSRVILELVVLEFGKMVEQFCNRSSRTAVPKLPNFATL